MLMHGTAPPSITPLLESILLDIAGIDRPDAGSAGIRKLAEGVRLLSEAYRSSSGAAVKRLFEKERLLRSYVLYYLPVNLVKLYPVLDELVRSEGVFPPPGDSLAVLDLGCGPGTFLLGVMEYLASRRQQLGRLPRTLTLCGVDRASENISTAETVIRAYLAASPVFRDRDVRAVFRHGVLQGPGLRGTGIPADEQFNIIIAGNVLTELSPKGTRLSEAAIYRHLAPGGALVLVDPGTRSSWKKLIVLRDLILQKTPLNLYAPCPRPGACPVRETGWCHEKVFWTPTAAVTAIDAHTGFTKTKGLKFSYFTFLRNRACLADTYSAARHNDIWRAVSYLICNKGEDRLLVCNGTRRVLLRRLVRNASEKNADFTAARRGDKILFSGAEPRKQLLDLGRQSIFRIL